jgi:hypothetical protein
MTARGYPTPARWIHAHRVEPDLGPFSAAGLPPSHAWVCGIAHGRRSCTRELSHAPRWRPPVKWQTAAATTAAMQFQAVVLAGGMGKLGVITSPVPALNPPCRMPSRERVGAGGLQLGPHGCVESQVHLSFHTRRTGRPFVREDPQRRGWRLAAHWAEDPGH